MEAGAFYVMDRGYVDFEDVCTRYIKPERSSSETRAKAGMDARRVYSATTDRTSGVICDQRVMLNGFYSARNYPEHLRRIRFKVPESGKTLVFLTNNTSLARLDDRRTVQEPLAGGTVLQVDQATPAHQAFPRHQRERGEDADLVRRGHGYVLIAIVKKELHARCFASTTCRTDLVGIRVRENQRFQCALQPDRSQSEPRAHR